MSNLQSNDSKGRRPPRWLHCPRKSSELIQNKFLAFKTPLSSDFDDQVPEECRFTPHMMFSSLKEQNIKMGLWIDLTNTSRFYERKDVEVHGCQYRKLPCRGHGETPSADQVQVFVKICQNFTEKHPLQVIGVHCTHGFNRTGFMIICYLIETQNFSVDAALAMFASARSPGIYKGDYIRELYAKFDDIEDAPAPPPRPAWCLEDDDEEDDDGYSGEEDGSPGRPSKRRKKEFNKKNPMFMAGVPGVKPLDDASKILDIQRRAQKLCGWSGSGFPGSQPVSMDRNNIQKLHKKPYRVSWKADGTRYLMLIQADGEVFFLDRDNSVFEVANLTFPHIRHTTRNIRDTLLDGEMVIDDDNGQKYPRYLVYDVIMYDGRDVKDLAFYKDRYYTITEIIEGRRNAMLAGRIRREREPFSVRQKEFWDVTFAGYLVSDKFMKKLSHEPDGLIFQPAGDPYVPGSAPNVLKWKPLSLNSVDFRLKIVKESGLGILPKKVGYLYVGRKTEPLAMIKITKAIRDLDNKIIECKFENNGWVFMRERTDKSFPNSYDTAMAVCNSILHPVATENLLEYIDKFRFTDDGEVQPPPLEKPR